MKIIRIVKGWLGNLRWLYNTKILLLLLVALFTFNAVTFSISADIDDFGKAPEAPKIRDNCLNEFKPLQQGLLAHYLASGETLYRLSIEYFVSAEELTAINDIKNPRQLMVGQKILIPAVHREASYIQKIQVDSPRTADNLIKKFQLKDWQFKRLNPTLNIATIKSPTVIYMPKMSVQDGNSGDAINLIIPVRGFVSSRYGPRWGRMHYGLDLAASYGSPVKAAAAGKVVFAGWNGGYGLLIKLNHGNIKTLYGHLSRILIKNGSVVRQGQVIGLVGATGRAYGSHLHFEVESYGRKVNPGSYILRN